MYAAPSEARNATVSAMSSGLPTRPNGFFAAVAASIAATSSDPMPGVVRIMGVSVNPGLTALTRMRRGASSRASVGIMVSSAPRDPAVRLLPVRLRVAPIPTVTMIEAPSDSSGSVFTRVKNCPLVLTANTSSKAASSQASSATGRLTPAFRNSVVRARNRARTSDTTRSVSASERASARNTRTSSGSSSRAPGDAFQTLSSDRDPVAAAMQKLPGPLPDPAGATGDQSCTCRHGVHAYLVGFGRVDRPSDLDHGVARARKRGAGSRPASAITLLSSATHRKNDPKAHLAAEHSSVRLGHATESELLAHGVYGAPGT